jgi:cobalt-zinc-cadmium efflux system outer membrane protein
MQFASPIRRALAAAPLLALAIPASAATDGGKILRLEDAQAAALQANPDLAAAAAEERALTALVQQAGRRPNPDLSVEVEDVAGTGDFQGTEESQTTVRLFQTVELGGDRSARRAVASHERDLAQRDAEARRLDLLAATSGAFVAVLVAQEELHHATELAELTRAERAVASERVRSGAALAVEEIRARVAEDEAVMHEVRGRTELDTARRALAATWAAPAPDFEAAEGALDHVSPPPLLESLLARRASNPDLARFEAERGMREAALALAHARRIPDPRIGAGARHLAGPNDASLLFEVAVPLPIFDRQDGAIAAASERVAKVASERQAADRLVQARLIAEHGRWAAAEEESRALRDRILPGSRRALTELRAAWRSGRASQLEVLAAQRTEFEAVDQLLHVLGDYHHARIACERLVGGFVDELR